MPMIVTVAACKGFWIPGQGGYLRSLKASVSYVIYDALASMHSELNQYVSTWFTADMKLAKASYIVRLTLALRLLGQAPSPE